MEEETASAKFEREKTKAELQKLTDTVNALLLHDLIKVCIKKNIKSAESNALLEENLKIQEFRKYFNFKQHKKRRLYFKSIS